jgi:hydroxyacylglutathione hydrolase
MLLERSYNDLLAQASYLLGCQESGTAMVVDPNRDIDRILALAKRHGMRIGFVAETHVHADFLSGARDLVRRTGATLLLSAEGDADWQYQYAASDGALLLRHGDEIDVGQLRLTVRHTPGHTLEHLCFVVTDRAVSERPVGMFSGDFIFVGDVGRPDLLEGTTRLTGTTDRLARRLFQSIEATSDLPDYLQLWPGHGPGSACGKALGAMPQTTLGYERLANWAFQIHDECDFVRQVLTGLPEVPKHFAMMKVLNRDGPAPTRAGQDFPELDLPALERAIASGASIVDVRSPAAFAAGHIPGALNLPIGSSLATWAGSVLPYDRQIVLLADNRGIVASARYALALVGLDRVVGWGRETLRSEWERLRGPLGIVAQLDVATLSASAALTVIDVRSAAEWTSGHLPGATHGFLGDLLAATRDVALDTPIAVHCQGGTRSAIAASLLQANGFTNVVNLAGGFRAWTAAGLPVERGADDLVTNR